MELLQMIMENSLLHLKVYQLQLLFLQWVFATKSVKVTNSDYLTIVVQEDNALNEIVLVGSRGKPRTAFDSPVPIDNIKISELTQTGQGVLDQQLMFKVPSYNSTQATCIGRWGSF